MAIAYDLHWKSIPMRAIQDYKEWEYPYLGRGVYLFVLATTLGKYVCYYVGKADDIGQRWWNRVFKKGEWFCQPREKWWLPQDICAFLENPVAEFNKNALEQRLPERQETAQAMLAGTWFCWAEVICRPWHRIENVEYALQEALKKHAGITKKGWIGDPSICPTSALTIRNRFGREFLVSVLPATISFTPGDGLRIG